MDNLEQTTVYGPGDAADQLGVAPATLRRYASLYSSVFESLNTDNRGGYLYTAEVLERLSAAKRMQEQGQAVSLEQALLMLREGVEAPIPAKVEKSEALDLSEEARGTLAAILRDELRAIVREELTEVVGRLQEQNRVLHEEIMALAPPSWTSEANDSDKETQAELEEVRRLNAYLKGEIVRRDLEAAEKIKRPWWKLW